MCTPAQRTATCEQYCGGRTEEVSMTSIRGIAVTTVVALLSVEALVAETPFQYRDYALASSVASVMKISNTREDRVKTLHDRPARIQELEWRAPYVSSGTELADPVRDILFSFFDDQLYQIVVTYDRDRIEGLTNDDLMETLSATYGVPLLRHSRAAAPADRAEDATVVARWEDAATIVTLTRGTYSPQVRLVLHSKTLNAPARAAITEALRLDTQQAPQREQDQRNKEVADARVASQKTRVVNKAAFKP
jgi:hypothetical protein